MQTIILELSSLSVLCGLIMALIPEGGCKKIAGILCTAVLLICIIKQLSDFNFETYAAEALAISEIEENFLSNSQMLEDKFNKFAVEEEYKEYITEKAVAQDIKQAEVNVETKWHSQGMWIPYSVRIEGEWTDAKKNKMIKIIEAGLGIPQERQYWQNGNS